MIRALAITVSNRAAAGVYADKSGPVLAEALRAAGCEVAGPLVIPDGSPVEIALQDAVEAGYDVVVTTGGTGLTPTDATPEMTRLLIDREVPGIAEAIRAAGVACRGPGRGAVPRRSRGGRVHAHRQPARLDRRRPRWHDRAVGPAAARRGPDQGRRPPAPGGGLMRSAAAPPAAPRTPPVPEQLRQASRELLVRRDSSDPGRRWPWPAVSIRVDSFGELIASRAIVTP